MADCEVKELKGVALPKVDHNNNRQGNLFQSQSKNVRSGLKNMLHESAFFFLNLLQQAAAWLILG